MLTSIEKLQRWILSGGATIMLILLIKFAIDFTAEMSLLLAAPLWLLVLAALVTAFWNLSDSRISRFAPITSRLRLLLLAAIPLAFFASSLDCTGLSVTGCAPYCTFIKTIWIPLIAIACAAYFVTARGWLLILISLMAIVPLAPHCVCYNVGNGWWIERLGASPVCYVWGYGVSVVSIGGLLNARRAWLSLLICGAIICGALTFFVAHHYFHFPW
jgi:hypothetical protein